MKKIIFELFILIGIGGLLWAAFAFFIKLPERPVLLSIEKEQSIGEVYRNMILNMDGFSKVENNYIDSVLLLTGQKLENALEDAKYQYEIVLVDNEMINAFALPGGFIIITTGLVDFCESGEELIAIISHEIGHIEKRHVITRLIKDIGLDLLKSNDPFVTGEIAATLLSSGYNRRQETEADLFASNLLLKSGIEPRTLATVFRRLEKEDNAEMHEHFELLSSHPNLEERVLAVLSFKIPADFIPKESWIEWETFKSEAVNFQQ